MPCWMRLCTVEQVREGEPAGFDTPGRAFAVYKVGTELFATDRYCTHGDADLCDGYQEGYEIECPLHQGRFDVRTGSCAAPPVTEDVRAYPVRVADGFVEVEVPDRVGNS